MFITQEDYSALIREEIKALLQEGYSDTKIIAAENMAISQVKNYLAGRYDVHTIFSQEENDRNSHVVMITIDLVLYHLYTSSIPDRMPTIRAERYQDAIDWLKLLASGDAMADLPKLISETGEPLTALKISSKHKTNNHRW
jgi:phage gp36-like protein